MKTQGQRERQSRWQRLLLNAVALVTAVSLVCMQVPFTGFLGQALAAPTDTTQSEQEMLIATSLALPAAAATDPTPINRDNASVHISIYQSADDRKAGTNPLRLGREIALSDTLYGKAAFDFLPGYDPTVGRLRYTYNLPRNIKTLDKPLSKLYDESGNVAGSWEIKDNVVNFYYSEDWALTHPSGGGAFYFDFSLDKDAAQPGEDNYINFPGSTETVAVSVKGITGTKKNYGAKDGVVTYSVKLNADADFDTFIFTDHLDKNLSYVEGSFTYDNKAFDVTVTKNDDGTQDAVAAARKIKKGSHTITYQATVDRAAYDALAENEKLTTDLNNVVTWKYGKDATNLKTGSAESTVTVTKDVISKAAPASVINGNELQWKIKVNNSYSMKSDVSGATVTDTLKKGMKYGDSFVVLDENEKEIYRGEIPEGAKSFSYTLPEDAGMKKFFITYSTFILDTTTAQKLTNSATISIGGSSAQSFQYEPGSKTDEGTGPTPQPKVTKEILDDSEASTTGVVHWHSTLTSEVYPDPNSGTELQYFDSVEQYYNKKSYEKTNQDFITNGVSLKSYYKIWISTEPEIYAGDKETGVKLVKDVDYQFNDNKSSHESKYGFWTFAQNYDGKLVPISFRVRFNLDSDTMHSVVENKTPIHIYYDTTCDKTNQSYVNEGRARVVESKSGAEKYVDIVQASYTIGDSRVAKAGDMRFDETRGKYVVQWEIVANRSDSPSLVKPEGNSCLTPLRSPLLTFTDELPEGMSLIEDSISLQVVRPARDGMERLEAQPEYTYSVKNGTFTVSVDLSKAVGANGTPLYDADTNTSYSWAKLRFMTEYDPSCVIHDGAEHIINNSATATSGDKVLGEGRTKVAYTDSVVKKTGKQEEGEPVVHYEIVVNEHAERLNADHRRSKINLTDQLDYRSTVVLSSVKVIDTKTNQDITKQCAVSLNNETKDKQNHPTSSFTVTVPDQRALLVTYDVKLSGDDGEEYEVSNKASLEGISAKQIDYRHQFKVNKADASVYGSNAVISITKSDSSNVIDSSLRLKGAEFQLYQVDMSKLPKGNYTAESLAKASTLVYTAETDANGSATLYEEASHALKFDTLYYFVESKAPKGYAIDDSSPHFVMVKGKYYDTEYKTAKSHGIEPSVNTTYNITDTKKTSTLLKARKVVTGTTLMAGQFSFELYENNKLIETVTNKADGSVVFSDIEYDEEGDHTYTIREKQDNQEGYTYDKNEAIVDVHVTKNEKTGSFEATADYGSASVSEVVFTNSYTAEGTAVIGATKELIGRDLKAGEFFFELRGDKLPGGVQVLHASNAEDGSIQFQPITFTMEDVGKDFTYIISETKGTQEDVVYDDTSYEVTLHVEDNGDGTLDIRYNWGRTRGMPTFTNKVLARTGFTFTKYSFGSEGRFDFSMTAVDKDGKPRTGDITEHTSLKPIVDDGETAFTASVKNGAYTDGAAPIVFPDIVYTHDGDYYYLVQEDESSVAGMTADEASYLVHVTVKNDKVVSTTYNLVFGGKDFGPTTDLSFYNNSAVTLGFDSLSAQSYNETDERVAVYPKAKKYLNGRTDLLVGGEYSFELIDGITGETIATTTNDANGDVAFFNHEGTGLIFDEPGRWYYYIQEVVPETNPEPGITYDNSIILLTVDVERTSDGLVATETYNGPGGAEPAFFNVKEGTDVVVQKVSRVGGEGLVDCTYALWMVGQSGDVMIAEATSDEAGFITFKDVALMTGQKYYFKEVEAPVGHTVDPYRTAYFTLNETGDALVLAEETAPDGWHSATEKKE